MFQVRDEGFRASAGEKGVVDFDGVLDHAATVGGIELAEHIISRLKVLAELDIAERRVPQDGRFKAAARGRAIDIRVSIMPSIHGEDAVLRVLESWAEAPGPWRRAAAGKRARGAWGWSWRQYNRTAWFDGILKFAKDRII